MGKDARTRDFLSRLAERQRPPAGGLLVGEKPPATVHDAYNRPLQVGDLCILPTDNVSPFVVTKIQPVVDPKAPPEMMEIVLNCTVRFYAPRAQPQREFSRVMSRQERGMPEEEQEKPAENFFEPDAEQEREPETVITTIEEPEPVE